MPEEIVHGFYRYTDIWFEWHKVLPNPEDAGVLKAILSHDALVHPDHPLRKEGKDGIDLTMGILPNGENRLLFTSAQVEYVRYWLHATGLTKELIPLPYSACMLSSAQLQSHNPSLYKDPFHLRNEIKRIQKFNKQLKGADNSLKARRLKFERVRSLWAEKTGVWCAIDFEAWDKDHTALTEVGWSFVRWVDGEPQEEYVHLRVEEHRDLRNIYVPSNPDHYNFGESEIVKKKEFKRRIHSLITSIASPGPLFLVFHDASQDLKYLGELSAPINSPSPILPESCAASAKSGTPEIFTVDTAELFAALEGNGGAQKRSLEQMCRHLQVKTEYLHNAGNDARYTHLALEAMASGDQLDVQREQRWPNHTAVGRGPRVQFSKLEEDSDASDWDEDDDEDDDPSLMNFQLGSSNNTQNGKVDGKSISVEISADGKAVESINGHSMNGGAVNGSNGVHA